MDKRVRAGLRIPFEQNTELIFIAQKLGISKNALLLQIIRDYLKKTKLDEDPEKAS